MSNRLYNQFIKNLENQPVKLAGQFLQSAGAISTVAAKGMSMAKTGTGLYTITLADPYNALLSCQVEIIAVAATALRTQIASIDVTSAKTIVIRTVSGSTATNMADGDGFLVELMLRNSSN